MASSPTGSGYGRARCGPSGSASAARPPARPTRGPSCARRWTIRRRRWPTRSRTRNRIDRRTVVDLPGNPAAGGQRALVQADAGRLGAAGEQPRRCARSTPARTTRRRRARSTGCAGSAPAGPTTPGCSAPTVSTPRTPRSRPGSSPSIKDHLRALRDVSEVINPTSGKIVHEVTPDGAVFFGADADAGNTDESSKYPSAVALVWRWTGDEALPARTCTRPASGRWSSWPTLDEDGDGWPERSRQRRAAGHGRGEARQRGLHHPRLRRPGRHGGRRRATTRPAAGRWARRGPCWRSSRQDWWYGGDTRSYADSLGDDNEKIFQRHWIGLTPTDAVLPRIPGRAGGPAGLPGARQRHAERARAELLHRSERRPLPHRHRADLGPGRQPGDRLRLGGLDRAERAQHLHAELGDRRGQRGQLRPARREPAGASTPPATPGRSSTRTSGRCPASCRRSCPAGTSAPTSTGCSPSARWCCRPGARTGCSGRSCTSGSASRPTSVAAGWPWCRSCRRTSGRRRPSASGSATTSASTCRRSDRGKTYLTEVRRRGDVRLTIGAVVPRGSEIRSVAPRRQAGPGRPGADRPRPRGPGGRRSGSGGSQLRVTLR